ncbi:MAG: midasin protein (ISS), partial [Trebouxia sp. A1-2]
VLEQGRTLTLAEKGGAGAEVITAAPDFRLVGTMNPGGDYGKKELSPALSNRFTQIWVPAIEDQAELAAIIKSRITDPAVRQAIADKLLDFWTFHKAQAGAARAGLSVRDLLAWVRFINAAAPHIGTEAAYAHGAHLVLLDGIGLGVGMPL